MSGRAGRTPVAAFRAVLCLAALCLGARAVPEDPALPGSCRVGRRIVGFPHAESSSPTGSVFGSVWYPAQRDGTDAPPDRGGAPWPHLVFFHGHTTLSGSYVTLISDLVGRGYVVTAVETNSGIRTELAEHAGFARDQRLFVAHVDALARDPADPFHGLVDPASPLGVLGHSLGASALFFYLPAEPRARAALALQPYVGPLYGGVDAGLAGARAYDGALCILSGDEDAVAPPWTQSKVYHDLARDAARVWLVVAGMAHLGPLESPPAHQSGTLPMSVQNRVHRLVAARFFGAALGGGDALLAGLEDELGDVRLAHVERVPAPLEAWLVEPWPATSRLRPAPGEPGLVVPGGAPGLALGPPLPVGAALRGIRIRVDTLGVRAARGALASVR